MILVAGGTGRLGTIVVRGLVDRGLDVRVVTRDPKRGAHLAADHVEVVTGDVRDRVSLERATAGIDVVLSAVHGFLGPRGTSPATVDRDGNANLIDATRASGADLVLMSTVGASAHSPMELFRMKYAAEQHAAGSGPRTTVVRATAFLELWIELLEQTASRSGRPLVFGGGDNSINFVSVIDVAAVVERAITDPTTRGQILEIGGPGNHTFNELAHAVQTAAGRTSAARHVPRPVLHLMAHSIGRAKPELGRQARAALVMDRLDLTFDPTPIHCRYPDLPTTSLADVLARPPVAHPC
ncbi:MAG: putative nucleoside diphosphate sugar epimerase [Acidimicrobiales bacterium]|nr:putative nucleoside diphosphate sugar epimerase [Acidimicrobiales bacterium]